MKMHRITTHHTSASTTYPAAGPPFTRRLAAKTTADTGWWFAHGCNHPGIDSAGTNAIDANTSGARTGNAAACAVSGSFTASPSVAKIQDSANPKNTTRSIAAIRASTLVWTRKPTRVPTTSIKITTNALRTRSAPVRPTRTADRVVGSDTKRSRSPLLRSVASPIAAARAPKVTVCTQIPGIRKSTYGYPGGSDRWTAPPKTYVNISTKMIGWIVENTRSWGTRL